MTLKILIADDEERMRGLVLATLGSAVSPGGHPDKDS